MATFTVIWSSQLPASELCVDRGRAFASGMFSGRIRSIQTVMFCPDGRSVISGSIDGTIRIWDINSGVMVGRPLYVTPASLPSSRDKIIRIWDLHSGMAIGKPLRGHSGKITSVTISPNGCYIASSSEDNTSTVRIWNAQS